MNHGISVSFSPIGGSWPILLLAIAAVTGLTLWAYSKRLRGTTGRWRWFALSLRLLAILLCLMAALRPKVTLNEKKKQAASLVYLIDTQQEHGARRRGKRAIAVGRRSGRSSKQAQEQAKTLGPDLNVKIHFFDSTLADPKPDEKGDYPKPAGLETKLGLAILEANKAEQINSKRIARLVIVSDFASNDGPDALEAARQLKGSDQAIKIVTVGLGTESSAANHRDISLRDIVTSPTVFVKNQVEVRGTVVAHGYANQDLNVELYVEGQTTPVAKTTVKVPEGAESVPITGVKFVPQTPGEKLLTLKVTPKEGEMVVSNNEMSTFVSVLSGGLNVLFLQGKNSTFDYRLPGAIDHAVDGDPDGRRGHPPPRSGRQERDRRRNVRPRQVQRLCLLESGCRVPDAQTARATGRGREERCGLHHAGRPLELRHRRLGRYADRRDSAVRDPPRRRRDRRPDQACAHAAGLGQLHPPGRRRLEPRQPSSGTPCPRCWERTASASERPMPRCSRRLRPPTPSRS